MRYELRFMAGKPETGFIRMPIPLGPYIAVMQGHEQNIQGKPWEQVFDFEGPYEISMNFNLTIGTVILGCINGRAEVIGAHYDTSD